MDLTRSIGLGSANPAYPDKKLLQYINLKLASLGCPTVAGDGDTEFQEMAAALKFMKYDYKFEFGTEGHNGKHGGAILPESLKWLWRDYGK
jgi:hypothetical protein